MSRFKKRYELISSTSDDTDSEIKRITAASKFLKLLDDKQVLTPEAWMTAFATPVDFYYFYVTKLQTLVTEMAKADRFLVECKTLMVTENDMKKTILARDDQITSMQSDVTELKCSLIQERSNYQALLREHELAKLELDDYRRKFNAALLLGGVTERDVGFLFQNNPKSPQILDKIGDVKKEISQYKSNLHEHDNPLILRKKIETLESHLKNLEKSRQSELDAFHETLEFAKEESKLAQKQCSMEARKTALELEEVKEFSHALLNSKLDLLRQVLSIEEEQMETKVELSRLKGLFDVESPVLDDFKPNGKVQEISKDRRPECWNLDLERVKNQLTEKENIIKEYELKFCRMEKEYRRGKESHSVAENQYEANKQKLYERIKILEQRWEKEDHRRKLETHGFHQDISTLRQFLTTLERRVTSAVLKQLGEQRVLAKQNVGHCTKNMRANVLKSGNQNDRIEKFVESVGDAKFVDYEGLEKIFRLANLKLAEVESKIKSR